MKKNKKIIKNTLFSILIISLIGLDLSTSLKNQSSVGSFKFETEFPKLNYNPTIVSIIPSDFPELKNPSPRNKELTYEQIEDMIRKAIELQGDLYNIIKKGDTVLLKVNLVSDVNGSGTGEVTDVRVVKAVIKIIDEIAHGQVHIFVGEGSARTDDDPLSTGAKNVWKVAGYQDLLVDPYLEGINFKLINLNGPTSDLIEVNIPGGKKTAAPFNGKYYVHKLVKKASVYISIPVLKIHNTGITCALKNQIGIAPGYYYGYNKTKGIDKFGNPTPQKLLHDANFPQVWTEEEIVDLSTIADVDYIIVDAIMCLEKDKTYNGTNQVRMNTIIAGKDPVAVDHVCAKLFCLNPDDVNHITLSEKVGLGTNDESKIIISGATIENIRKKVIKNQSVLGLYGQSNRTWILSQAYSGTSIEDEPITNEAYIEPQPGKNGWSEPVYFFDDRIDLLNFYNGQINIITYAFTYFYSPKEQEAELWLGSHEGMYVYINNLKVYSFNGTRTYDKNIIVTDKLPILIKKGINKLLVKTINNFGDYTFALNICEVETNNYYAGNRVEGLKFIIDTTPYTKIENQNIQFSEFNFECYPIPAKNFINIKFYLSSPKHLKINVYDFNGNFIKNLFDNYCQEGEHIIKWDFNNKEKIKPGIYICTIETNNKENFSKKIIIK